MNAKFPTAPPGGFVLASFPLRVSHDVVLLRRRTRATAEEFGLDTRTVSSLAAAAYEGGRLIFSAVGAAQADLSVIEGPALRVSVRASNAPLDDARRALHGSLEALRLMVDSLSLEDTPAGISVSLAVAMPAGRVASLDAIPQAAAEPLHLHDPATVDLQQQNDALQRSLTELQTELQETNRGVVALYAELEDQAGRLRHAEERLRVLLDSVQDYAICMLDAGGEVASWNAGAQRLFGYTADAIVGQSWACFYPADDRGRRVPADELAAAREHGRFECEGLRVRQDGTAFDAHVLITPLGTADSVPRGYSLVVRDITERKRLEDDLRRRAEDLAAANRAKEDFLATLSHELRTPLNAMLGWTRLLRMGKLEATGMSRALETIERNAHIQEQLIADILDVSRIVTGKLRLALRPLELAPIVDAALDAVRPTADAKGIHLSCDVAMAGTVLGDPDRLQQVAWNLLSNAIKFTPAGGHVRIAVGRSGSDAVMTVTDTGEGIKPELLPLVFDRFIQGDGSVTRPHGGLGLGLSIVRHIVELHGGEVHASSDGPGRGSHFSVSLPVRGAARPAGERDGLPDANATDGNPAEV